jgi:hypothetical protein
MIFCAWISNSQWTIIMPQFSWTHTIFREGRKLMKNIMEWLEWNLSTEIHSRIPFVQILTLMWQTEFVKLCQNHVYNDLG